MRQEQVTIGMTARVKIGSRLAEVRVLRRLDGRGRARFECVTQDTGRVIKATAARLRPMPGSPEAAAVAARKPAADRKPRAYTGIAGDILAFVPPVPGMAETIGAAPVAMLTVANADFVGRIVGAAHVAETFLAVARRVRQRIGRAFVWQTIPRALRRGLLHAAASRHAANRRTYREIMGTAPFPTEEMIGRAILGTDADRAALLRHADRLAAGN